MSKDRKLVQLEKEIRRVDMEISVTTYPFIEPEHPAFDILTEYLIKQAQKDDFSLFMQIEQRVAELTDKRTDLMAQLKEYKKMKEKESAEEKETKEEKEGTK